MTDTASMTSSSSRLVLALLVNLALGSGGCAVFGSGDSPSPAPEADTQAPPQQGADGGVAEGPKAPAVGGPASQNELTDQLGIFVAPTGLDSADGTHARPLATIQAGIDKAKAVGKRVYVCVGTYTQAIELADSISIIGGLDCTGGEWHTGTGVSRIEAPTSPAVRAKNITTATRLEGLDVHAPNATAASGSSIGLFADHATALVVARTKIVAGNAMKGDDGVVGATLHNAATINGTTGNNSYFCSSTTCAPVKDAAGKWLGYWSVQPLTPGGSNTCSGGAAPMVVESGGRGGNGGLHQYVSTPVPPPGSGTFLLLQDYKGRFGNSTGYGRTDTPDVRTGEAGADGPDGLNGAAIGTVSVDGYVPGNGTNGSDGATGSGGAGGNGLDPDNALPKVVDDVWRGWMGHGGGAGGCPGLAGTAGKGGGASFAALLLESPVTFDASELVSGLGGAGGLAGLGSAPTLGGAPGNPPAETRTALNGQPGGRGGIAGVSGNGGSGPSAAIAHFGPAPILVGDNKTTPGAGGAEIPARSTTEFGVTKTVPATPAGVSQAILAL